MNPEIYTPSFYIYIDWIINPPTFTLLVNSKITFCKSHFLTLISSAKGTLDHFWFKTTNNETKGNFGISK